MQAGILLGQEALSCIAIQAPGTLHRVGICHTAICFIERAKSCHRAMPCLPHAKATRTLYATLGDPR